MEQIGESEMLGYKFVQKCIKKQWPSLDDDCYEIFPLVIVVCVWLFILLRTGYGIAVANDKDECIVNSYADIVVAPFYALGCNLGKDRFDQSLIIGE
jgi:hypothetical protein